MPTAKKTTIKKTPVKAAKVVKVEIKEVKKVSGLTAEVFDLTGKAVEKIELPKEIFDAKENKQLVAQSVRVYLANQRKGTLSTKSRGEVNISTRKIYKQKGTGRARHGAKSAPIFVGGGIAFGPKPRDFSLKFSQKMKKLALFSVLTAKQKEGSIKLLAGLEKAEPKTKNMESTFINMEFKPKTRKILLVTTKEMEKVNKATRNLKGVKILNANLLNAYEALNNKNIFFAKEAIEVLKNTFLKENK